MRFFGSSSKTEGPSYDEHLVYQNGKMDSVFDELWQLSVGPFATIPRFGEKVYFFPQHHFKQVAVNTNRDPNLIFPSYNLPTKVLCRVVNIELMAEMDTDEVLAQVTLLPEAQHKEEKIPWFLMKCADESPPPLDMPHEYPMQDLIRKDLQGTEWCFRCICHGHKPKQLVLTSGWSSFATASRKKHVTESAFVFLRGEEDGKLASVLSNRSMQLEVLASVSHGISTGSMFSVYYKPRSPPEFIVPYEAPIQLLSSGFLRGASNYSQHGRSDCLPEKRRCVNREVLSKKWKERKNITWARIKQVLLEEKVEIFLLGLFFLCAAVSITMELLHFKDSVEDILPWVFLAIPALNLAYHVGYDIWTKWLTFEVLHGFSKILEFLDCIIITAKGLLLFLKPEDGRGKRLIKILTYILVALNVVHITVMLLQFLYLLLWEKEENVQLEDSDTLVSLRQKVYIRESQIGEMIPMMQHGDRRISDLTAQLEESDIMKKHNEFEISNLTVMRIRNKGKISELTAMGIENEQKITKLTAMGIRDQQRISELNAIGIEDEQKIFSLNDRRTQDANTISDLTAQNHALETRTIQDAELIADLTARNEELETRSIQDAVTIVVLTARIQELDTRRIQDAETISRALEVLEDVLRDQR